MAVKQTGSSGIPAPVATNAAPANFRIAQGIGDLVGTGIGIGDALSERKFRGDIKETEIAFENALKTTDVENISDDLIASTLGIDDIAGVDPEVKTFLKLQAQHELGLRQGVLDQNAFAIAVEADLSAAIARNPRLRDTFIAVSKEPGGGKGISASITRQIDINLVQTKDRTARLAEHRAFAKSIGVNMTLYDKDEVAFWEQYAEFSGDATRLANAERQRQLTAITTGNVLLAFQSTVIKEMPGFIRGAYQDRIAPAIEQITGGSPLELSRRIQDGTVNPERLKQQLQLDKQEYLIGLRAHMGLNGVITQAQFEAEIKPVIQMFDAAIDGIGGTTDIAAIMEAHVQMAKNSFVLGMKDGAKLMFTAELLGKVGDSGVLGGIAGQREAGLKIIESLNGLWNAADGGVTSITGGPYTTTDGLVDTDPNRVPPEAALETAGLNQAEIQKVMIGMNDVSFQWLNAPDQDDEIQRAKEAGAIALTYRQAVGYNRKHNVGASASAQTIDSYMKTLSHEGFQKAYQKQPDSVRAILEPMYKDSIFNEFFMIVGVEARTNIGDAASQLLTRENLTQSSTPKLSERGLGIADPGKPSTRPIVSSGIARTASASGTRTIPVDERAASLYQVMDLETDPSNGRTKYVIAPEGDSGIPMTPQQKEAVQLLVDELNVEWSDRLTNLVRSWAHVSFFDKDVSSPYSVAGTRLRATMPATAK